MIDRPEPVAWHTQDRSIALSKNGGDAERGLTTEEAAKRLLSHGKNELKPAPTRSLLALFLSQFRDVLILVLLGAAVLSGLSGDVEDVVVILAIVLVNAAIGSTQEARAENAVRALRSMLAPTALVRRSGETRPTDASAIVPGDLVVLEAGAVVPCDLRLLEANALLVQESTLTGESQPVHKQTEALTKADLPLGDRTNMAYKGTLVSSGRGLGLAIATGMATELGRIATLLNEGESTRTPLQVRLASFGRRLSAIVLAIALLVFVVGAVRGEPWDQMLLLAISLAVAAIPEALPAVVTIALALGARRMAARNAVVRRLPAVETLGSVTYLCTDKTGTLTQNSMQVRGLFTALAEHERLPPESTQLRLAMAISNDVVSDGDSLRGEATETALCTAAAASGLRRDAAIAEW
ncbi:MAG: HAD-IC family P-type ATPase, partial [Planctomycetota bacterium]